MQTVWIKNAIALCLIVESCNGSDFKGPSNTSVPEGTRATLSCRTSPSKTVWWKYFENYVFYANTIAHGYKSSHEAYVDASRGMYNLTVLNASSHAGLYTCIDDDGEGESRSAWLTVTANETPSNPPAGNNTLTVAITVSLVVISIIVIVPLIKFRRRLKCCKLNDSGQNPTIELKEGLLSTRSQLEGAGHSPEQEVNNIEDPIASADRKPVVPPKTTETTETTKAEKSTPEPRENSSKNGAIASPGKQVDLEKTQQNEPLACTTSTGIEEPKSPTTSSYVARNSQTASSISNPQKGPVTKSSKPNEQETPLASTTHETTTEEKEKSENDNVNTTKPKSTIESKNMKDDTQIDPMKPATRKDKKPVVPPEPEKTTTAEKSTPELRENSSKNGAIASPEKQVNLEKTHQKEPLACTTSTGIEESKSPKTSSYVARYLQAASPNSNPQKGPVTKLSKPNEQEAPLASTTPEEKEKSENGNVNTTKPKSIIESTNTTDNTQTDPLKPATRKDNRPEVLPKLEKTTKTEESTPEPRENSSKNGAIASPGKQVAKEKPPISLKPNIDLKGVKTNVGLLTEDTTKKHEICPASNAEQGKDDSNPKQPEEGIPQQQDKERDLSKELLTEDDDKK